MPKTHIVYLIPSKAEYIVRQIHTAEFIRKVDEKQIASLCMPSLANRTTV